MARARPLQARPQVLATTRTFAIEGIDAVPVDVEVDINRGLPAFTIVGLPDAAVRESRERVRAAIVNTGFDFPLQRITANLAPADLRKAGPGFDLALATAILIASGQLPAEHLCRYALVGELALDGAVRPTRGVLAMAEQTARIGPGGMAVAVADAADASLVGDLRVAPLAGLGDLRILATDGAVGEPPPAGATEPERVPVADLAELRGQPSLRFGLEVAAAGGHGLLVVGPPGAGKTLGARRLPSILPPIEGTELVEVRRIASAIGRSAARVHERPFRAPHHSISPAGLIGGGSTARPGEITLAHRGVLLLDELPEFARSSLEALRQPLETGEVTIGRARGTVRFPASFQLIATANPCPCGRGPDSHDCRCSPALVERYAAKLSGPLADRIDLSIAVEQPSSEALAGEPEESSASVRERVSAARERQRERYGEAVTNARVPASMVPEGLELGRRALEALHAGREALGLSARGWARAARVARTCADLAGSGEVLAEHVEAALAVRRREGVGA